MLLPSTGSATIEGRKFSLDSGVAGYDYTHGMLNRHTTWRWAFALGRTKEGIPIAFNVVQGYVGEPECAVWIGNELVGVGEGRFEFDRATPLSEWRIRTSDKVLDVKFAPGAMHADKKNLGLVRSDFVQPVGTYSGTIRIGDRVHELENVLGVAEDQNVVW